LVSKFSMARNPILGFKINVAILPSVFVVAYAWVSQ